MFNMFPEGLIHFQFNVGNKKTVAIAGLSSQNPGVITVGNAVFGSVPPISPCWQEINWLVFFNTNSERTAPGVCFFYICNYVWLAFSLWYFGEVCAIDMSTIHLWCVWCLWILMFFSWIEQFLYCLPFDLMCKSWVYDFLFFFFLGANLILCSPGSMILRIHVKYI